MTITAKRLDGFTQELSDGRGHTIIVDEPVEIGGNDKGPRPTELLAMSLASCAAVTMEMYARRKDIDLARLEVDVDYAIDNDTKTTRFDLVLKLPAGLTDDQRERLRVIAGKCPVHRALVGTVEIADQVHILEAT